MKTKGLVCNFDSRKWSYWKARGQWLISNKFSLNNINSKRVSLPFSCFIFSRLSSSFGRRFSSSDLSFPNFILFEASIRSRSRSRSKSQSNTLEKSLGRGGERGVMENLISLVNKLQRACTSLGDHGEESALPTLWDSLPAIAVVGGQVSSLIPLSLISWDLALGFVHSCGSEWILVFLCFGI